MRIDAPIFIPSGNPPPTHTTTDGPQWLALETICEAHERYRKDASQGGTMPLVGHAARALDTLDPKLEALIARVTLNPDNYRIRHDNAPVPQDALQAFHQAIVRRDVLSRSIEVAPKTLVALLRPLTGLSARWVSDRRLAQAIPPDLMTQLQRALVFVLFPGESLHDLMRANVCPHSDELKQGVDRMSLQWQKWAETVTQLAMPPELPPGDYPFERMLTRHTLIELARTDPIDRAALANARLDLLDFTMEEHLHYAANTPRLADWTSKKSDNDQVTWDALRRVLNARMAARPDLTLIGRALGAAQTTVGVTMEPRAALLLPITQTHALARSAAGQAEARGLDSATAMGKVIENMGELNPRAWSALCKQLDDIEYLFSHLSEQHPMLDALLGKMWDAYNGPTQARELISAMGADVFSAASEALESLCAKGETSDTLRVTLNQAIGLFREQNASQLTGTELPIWLATLSRQAERNRADAQSLIAPLAEIGLGGNPSLAWAFADAARGQADQRTAAARQLFEQFKTLPPQAQLEVIRNAKLDTSRPSATTRTLLASWRASEAPHLPALADLFERVSNRIREYAQKQASQRVSEGDNHLLNEAIERAKRERTQAAPNRAGTTAELDAFVQKLPTGGDASARKRAVRTALQELSPLALSVLLIESNNTMLSQVIRSKMPGQAPPVTKHQPTTLTYIINEAARLVRQSKTQPNLGDLRVIMRGLLEMMPLSSMLDGLPNHKLGDRMMMCLDNFASWVYAVSHAIDAPARVRILESVIEGMGPIAPAEAKRIWDAQIRDAIRINGMDNYLDLRFDLIQIPAIGPQLLNIWNTALDVHAARMHDAVNFSELSGDWQKTLNLTTASIRQLRDRLGSGFLVLSQLPDFRDKLDAFLSVSGRIAGGHGRANVGAMLAHHIIHLLRALTDNPFHPLS